MKSFYKKTFANIIKKKYYYVIQKQSEKLYDI